LKCEFKNKVKIKKPKPAQRLGSGLGLTSPVTMFSNNLHREIEKVKCKGGEVEGVEISQVINFLNQKLKSLYLHFKNQDGEFLTFRAPKRGTSDYSNFYIQPRFRQIKRRVEKLLKLRSGGKDWGLTNALFLTYTFNAGVFQSWEIVKNFSGLFDKVKKRLKRAGFKILFGLSVVEAQKSGRAHIHLLIIFNKKFSYRVDREKGRSFVKNQSQFEKFEKIFNLGLGFFDLQPVFQREQALSYLTKYIKKGAEGVEGVLERVDQGLGEGDLKRILALYFLLLFRIRFFNVFGEYRKLDKPYSNNLDRWQRLNLIDLALWLDFLAQSGLINWLELGVRSIRGSPSQPEKGLKIIF
jgi:hypothetical protein